MNTRITYSIHVSGDWQNMSRDSMAAGLTRVAMAIRNQAVINAPIRTGALKNSGRVQYVNWHEQHVIFGSKRVPYAELRERINHLHPATTHYLERAGKTVEANVNMYFQERI